MPAYNAASYIAQAVQSVLCQTYADWELLVINDGSTDDTEMEVTSYNDPRIRYFSQENRGVSAARNVGLISMKGNYFCFLDADDEMPPKSLESRINVFVKDATLSFVDGRVLVKDANLSKVFRCYQPSFRGYPFSKLTRLSEQCFLGNTWMIKRDVGIEYSFSTSAQHSEDILFYLSIARAKRYSYTEEEILYYRRIETSAMHNLLGLEEGYIHLYETLRDQYRLATKDLLYVRFRIIRIMVLSYLRLKSDLMGAIRVFFRYMALR